MVTEYLLLTFLIDIAKLLVLLVVGCTSVWLFLTIRELIDKFMKKYCPRFYYYDYDEEA